MSCTSCAIVNNVELDAKVWWHKRKNDNEPIQQRFKKESNKLPK